MEHLIVAINQKMPESIMHIVVALHTTPGHVVLALVLMVSLFIVRYILRHPVRSTIKLALFLRRNNMMYRQLFQRYDKLVQPFGYLISLFFIRRIIELFLPADRIDFFFEIVYILLIAWWAYEVVKFLLYTSLSIRIHRQEKVRKEFFNLFLNIFKIIIAVMVILVVLSRMGVDLTGLITSLGIGGVLIGFTAKDTLTNFFDSIRLVSEQAFSLGDWIETKDVEGFVVEIGLAATRIRTFENALVTIPNSRLANSAIHNWSARLVGRRIKFNLRIKYTYDMTEIERVLHAIRSMLDHHPDVVNDAKLRDLIRTKRTVENGLFNIEDKYGVKRTLLVYFDSIDTYSMNLLVYAFSISVNWEEWLRVKQDVLMRIVEIVDASSLELAVPQEEILLENRPRKIESEKVNS
jgi:MscS family membrane protein